MLGAGLGGVLLDHASITATFVGGAVLLVAASILVGTGARLRRNSNESQSDEAVVAASPSFH
jgi:predicted MFS family arabinose efflux permease